ncbi:hypothetical protein D3C85_1323150 [compost metagenome]|jgi:hypothetical protein|nr:hypothetical protein ELQ88_16750 [Pseudomonas sp. MPC6]
MYPKDKLLWLIEQSGVTQAQAAELIAQETKRPCSVRSVRAWLAAPDKSSARTCPAWAVNALETRLLFLKIIV